MGCPCREIRAALEHLPGGKFLVGLLPALPPEKGIHMKMLAPVAGQSFGLAHGPRYTADADRVIYVAADDVAEMRRVGCIEAPAGDAVSLSTPVPALPDTLELIKIAPRLSEERMEALREHHPSIRDADAAEPAAEPTE